MYRLLWFRNNKKKKPQSFPTAVPEEKCDRCSRLRRRQWKIRACRNRETMARACGFDVTIIPIASVSWTRARDPFVIFQRRLQRTSSAVPGFFFFFFLRQARDYDSIIYFIITPISYTHTQTHVVVCWAEVLKLFFFSRDPNSCE